ncbi:unnamed protein product, partial [marine sediment metagenome]
PSVEVLTPFLSVSLPGQGRKAPDATILKTLPAGQAATRSGAFTAPLRYKDSATNIFFKPKGLSYKT